MLCIIQSGLLAESPSKRISGISPVRPRIKDGQTEQVRERSMVIKQSPSKPDNGEPPTEQVEAPDALQEITM